MMLSSSSSAASSIFTALELSLGSPELVHKIRNDCQLLVVGAGGIGCELLKNLALVGFRNVRVIDLDTIDVSNLNRQLLFRSQHVGMPKCTVACQVASELANMVASYNKDTNNNNNDDEDDTAKDEKDTDDKKQKNQPIEYIAYHGNVCDNTLFNVQFVQQADLVLNALDNVVARRRVNRLCLAAGVPLIEAGTTGYLGQVSTIHKDSNVACYECKTQESQKVYPICTIRSTPSAPVHTIVWAKELYKLLLGPQVQESMLYEDTSEETDEPSTYMESVLKFRSMFQSTEETAKEKEKIVEAISEVITKLYIDEIQKQLDMDRYKTARKKPVTLQPDIIAKGCSPTTTAPTLAPKYQQTDIWSQEECVAEMVACLSEAVLAAEGTVAPAFDKDDPLSMRFVTAASNLRSYLFSIEPIQSYYSAKGIAGNIIPAIASTNAIAAGLQILQAFQVLKAQLGKKNDETLDLRTTCKYLNLHRHKLRNGLLISSSHLEAPNPNCFVCKNAAVPLTLTVAKWNLQDFLEKIIKKDLGFEEPTISIDGDIIWEEGEDADTDSFKANLTKQLPALPCGGIQNGTMVSVEDFSQDLEIQISICNQDVWETSEEEGPADDHKFVVGGTKPAAKKQTEVTTKEDGKEPIEKQNKNDDDDDDDIIMIVDEAKESANAKRSAETETDAPPAKRARTEKPNVTSSSAAEAEVIEIDDD